MKKNLRNLFLTFSLLIVNEAIFASCSRIAELETHTSYDRRNELYIIYFNRNCDTKKKSCSISPQSVVTINGKTTSYPMDWYDFLPEPSWSSYEVRAFWRDEGTYYIQYTDKESNEICRTSDFPLHDRR